MEQRELAAGDLVTHWRDPERVGYVAEIEPDKYSFDDPTYHVVWPCNGVVNGVLMAIPYRRYHHLRLFEIPQEDNR